MTWVNFPSLKIFCRRLLCSKYEFQTKIVTTLILHKLCFIEREVNLTKFTQLTQLLSFANSFGLVLWVGETGYILWMEQIWNLRLKPKCFQTVTFQRHKLWFTEVVYDTMQEWWSGPEKPTFQSGPKVVAIDEIW